jgi:hypothetical protein
MKTIVCVLAAMAASFATGACAQGVNLTGQYRCVQLCAGPEGQPAFVTQNGWDLNLVNEAGEPSRAWVDWVGHIWADRWNEGAVYSPDGMTIQFDHGTVWQRDLGEPIIEQPVRVPRRAPPPRHGKKSAAAATVPPVTTAYDGNWSVLIITENGGCDRAYRYGVQISDGDLVNDSGESVNLQGHVAPNGSVHVSVSASGEQANGEGRMSRNVGNGVWRGDGAGGSCSGTWQAVRRG